MIDTEPQLRALLETRQLRRAQPPYEPQADAAIETLLNGYFAREMPGVTVSAVERLGGGASKEQFSFTLNGAGGDAKRYVLRMDPMEGITETSREREFEILSAMAGVVPVPRPIWLDAEPTHFPRPAVIMELVPGSPKPAI